MTQSYREDFGVDSSSGEIEDEVDESHGQFTYDLQDTVDDAVDAARACMRMI